ncbi:MAG: ATP-binding protein [Chloroflexi bacterium]|nr:ATP-binding protein [Chloroflexota bacterium]
MNARMPFIAREDELKKIESLINERGTRRILWIQGPGGSGKTRLLEEVCTRFLRQLGGSLSSGIIDFDDRILHVPENLERVIAQNLGEQAYAQYLSEIQDWRKMQDAGVSPEALNRQSEHVYETLIRNFALLSEKRRIVLLFDTVEKAEDDVWERLCQLIQDTHNVFFLLTSREQPHYWNKIDKMLGKDAELIVWKPMEDNAFGELYISHKERALSFSLPSDMRTKILYLVGGSPILIDMAVDTISHNFVPEPLVNLKADSILSLSKTRREKMRQNFESQLVRRVIEMREVMDQLILVMSRIYPLDDEMIAILLNVSSEIAKDLLEKAKLRVYVKTLPDNRITLHDEVRSMVKNYIWDYIDPQKKRRTRDSKIVVEYFKEQEKKILAEIKKLRAQQNDDQQDQAQKNVHVYNGLEVLQNLLWSVREQLLDHALYIDPNKIGLTVFSRIFDEATRTYNFPYRDILLKLVEGYYECFSTEQKYEIDNRHVKALLDSGKYTKAENLSAKILRSTTLSPEKRVDMLIQYGNIKIRLGYIKDGRDYFENAVKLCQRKKMKPSLVPALNALGWSYRLLGDSESAIENYKRALELSIQTKDRLRRAWILNNLAFVYSQQARFGPALALCDQANELWEQLNFGRGLGALYEVYGAIYARMGQFEKAVGAYVHALGKFDKHDYEWLSRIHAGLGLVYRLTGELHQAERELEIAREYKIKRDEAMILHRLAHVKSEMGQSEMARRLFEESYAASVEISDAYHELNNLGDLSKIAIKEKKYDRLKYFTTLYRKYKNNWPDMTYARAEGMLLKHLADLAMGLSSRNYAVAERYYRLAFTLLARYETYQEYTVQNQLINVERHWENLKVPLAERAKIARLLYTTWKKENLSQQHPEATSFFVRWMEEAKIYE